MKHYAGLDLSMEPTHVCVTGGEGRKSRRVMRGQRVLATPGDGNN